MDSGMRPLETFNNKETIGHAIKFVGVTACWLAFTAYMVTFLVTR